MNCTPSMQASRCQMSQLDSSSCSWTHTGGHNHCTAQLPQLPIALHSCHNCTTPSAGAHERYPTGCHAPQAPATAHGPSHCCLHMETQADQGTARCTQLPTCTQSKQEQYNSLRTLLLATALQSWPAGLRKTTQPRVGLSPCLRITAAAPPSSARVPTC